MNFFLPPQDPLDSDPVTIGLQAVNSHTRVTDPSQPIARAGPRGPSSRPQSTAVPAPLLRGTVQAVRATGRGRATRPLQRPRGGHTAAGRLRRGLQAEEGGTDAARGRGERGGEEGLPDARRPRGPPPAEPRAPGAGVDKHEHLFTSSDDFVFTFLLFTMHLWPSLGIVKFCFLINRYQLFDLLSH